MKILILKPSSLGDVIHALPVLRLLKLHQPAAEIFWWLETGFAPLLANDPDLTGVYHFNRQRWAAPGHWREIATVIADMRRQHFDVAIDLQGLARSAVFAWLAHAGVNIGLDSGPEGSREGARMAYDLVPSPLPPGNHAVDRYLSVLSLLDVPVHDRFDWLPARPAVAAQLQERWTPAGARWITLVPGARWDNKRWPIESFQELTRQLLALAPDLKISVIGGNSDRGLGAAITATNPARCLDLTGRTSLPEMIEWLRLSALTITNDTGPMHVAAALRKPVVALFGPTNPDRTGPYGQRHHVLHATNVDCAPCLRGKCANPQPLACLHALTPTLVRQAAARHLA